VSSLENFGLGLGLEGCSLGLSLGLEASGLGLEGCGLFNIPVNSPSSPIPIYAEVSMPLTGRSRMLPGKSFGEVKISQLVFVLEQFELMNIPYISTIWHHSQCCQIGRCCQMCSFPAIFG